MSETLSAVGAYSPFKDQLSSEAKLAFDEAFQGFVGVKYQPVAFAQQVVNGVNFKFFCNAEVVIPGSVTYPAMVTIYKPREGRASITHIAKVLD
ncbi:hypothetical protein KDD30_12695 [Photobacterium sp. GJ3]|uniref:hypothetical protein n=1 Tax=Photobacterium sp. GJ3 TaxID=2829502 RepID=UPI001B8CD547|nr:hypothetical protein [Photobacterium sp. GJ3]QUJ66956.1 hypothetical protein KDD30_12695 [Photobacterium sp. GJ3]